MTIINECNLAQDFWGEYGEELFEALKRCCFPLYTCSDAVSDGISICEVRYKNKKEKIRTKWLENRPLKNRHQLMVKCQWSFRPILIEPGRRSIVPEDLRYWYMMYVKQDDDHGNSISYKAKIITGIDGTLFKKEFVSTPLNIRRERTEEYEDKNKRLKLQFAFPKRLVSKMNRCLSNYFLPHLWVNPPWAVWYRADGNVAYYLGVPEIDEIHPSFFQSLFSLINGPSGDAALVLLAYSCFSILKPFFPSFHTLSKKTAYVKARKSIPKQIAINIYSSNATYAESLTEISCGYFRELERNKVPIIDGILVQKCSPKMKRLSRNEFETKILNSACVLWLNREPATDLIQSGEILNLEVKTWHENNLDSSCSKGVVNLTAYVASTMSKSAYTKFGGMMWRLSKPCIEKYLIKVETIADEKKHFFSLDNIDIAQEKNLMCTSSEQTWQICESPIEYINHLHLNIKYDIFEILLLEEDNRKEQLEELLDDLNKEYKKAVCALRKICKDLMRLIFSLDSPFQKILNRLLKDQSVCLMGKNVAEKIAYLLTSFLIFTQSVLPLKTQSKELCDRVEAALISAFQSQLGVYQLRGILEKYILCLLHQGQCTRIRGKYSNYDDIRAWYDPSSKMFLIPAKTYFNDLKKAFPMTNANKRDFETELVRENILQSVRRGKQERRTFEVVVQTGEKRISVLKINAALLSEQFSQSAHKYLEQMKNDKTPYRSP